MRIKKLELLGFKSFKDRTVVHFDQGITGIVGPNGCGKSNIVDALTWVMGEMSAKQLRGSSMDDVIFAGAEGYSPMGLAEVSLVLENDGSLFPAQYSRMSEIMVTRRIHRSGDSEYLINKETARLKDIQEIFMDTGAGAKGFSIIQQNAIGQLVTAKPEDRRSLIEEAAGITKFRVRKKESQRKLASTEQNLLRLSDIVQELKRQLASLERQANKAEKYRGIKRELEKKEVWLYSRRYSESIQESVRVKNDLEVGEEQLATLRGEFSQIELEISQLRLEQNELEVGISRKAESTHSEELATQRLEGRINELKLRLENLQKDQANSKTRFDEIQAKRTILEKDHNTHKEELSQLEMRVNHFQEEEVGLKEQLREVEAHQKSLFQEVEQDQDSLNTMNSQRHRAELDRTILKEKTTEIQERRESYGVEFEELKAQEIEVLRRRKLVWDAFEKLRQEQFDLCSEIESFQEELKEKEEKLESTQTRREEVTSRLSQVSSHHKSLTEILNNLEGYQDGVRNLLLPDDKGERAFRFPILADVVSVPEEWELAVEAVCGQRLQALMTNEPSDVLAAIEHLKKGQLGRAHFLMQQPDSSGTESGEVKPFPPVPSLGSKLGQDVNPNLLALVRNTFVVDNLEQGIELSRNYPDFEFVTKSGESVAGSVASGGGGETTTQVILRQKRELENLKKEQQNLQIEMTRVESEVRVLKSQTHSLREELARLGERRVEREIKLASIKKDTEGLEGELKGVLSRLEKVEAEMSSCDREFLIKEEACREAEHLFVSLGEEMETLREKLQQNKDALGVVSSKVSELKEVLGQCQVSLATVRSEYTAGSHQLRLLVKALEDVEKEIAQLDEREGEADTLFLELNREIVESQQEFERKLVSVEEAKRGLSAEREVFEQGQVRLRSLESRLSEQQTQVGKVSEDVGTLRVKAEEVRLGLSHFTEQVREKYMLELSEIYEERLSEEMDSEDVEADVLDLKSRLGKMGEVNLSAIEEYEALEQRYSFLAKQQEDLIESKEQLLQVIDKINKICDSRFRETFERVNERFRKVFPVLFGGGEAELKLVENEEKGDVGIDIVAKPPGKKMQSISLLSGGEKALTAVCLIFSIFLVKPSPYCLLDEVDAPLDDANVYRFNDLVREMAKRSQIIVVTHNKYTMEAASKLYGVTMEEKGVSKMVSVDLQAQTLRAIPRPLEGEI